MRRDLFLQNDSGGLSVIAGDAVDAVIADARSNDLGFVTSCKALLLELYGDDSMPVRLVVDEPLRPEEQAEWLARATWRIDSSDARLLVMGGFDPDILAWWKRDTGGAHDGTGVALIDAAPGSWRVDVYAHAGSMNGRAILHDAKERPGAAFRRSHPGRAFPLWLAKMLDLSGEDDPGHEALWDDVRGSIAAGTLTVDTEATGVVGFLVHLTPSAASPGEPPPGAWFDYAENRRVPERFPLGVPSAVADPDLERFRDDLLGRKPPAETLPVATAFVPIIDTWSGDGLEPLAGDHPAVNLSPAEAFLLFWLAAMTSDSPPQFELRISGATPWPLPASTAEYAVSGADSSTASIGPPPNFAGWSLWRAARDASGALTAIPDNAMLDLAMAPRIDDDADDEESETNPAVGRARYRGVVSGGRWTIREVSPRVSRDVLDDALAFVRDVVDGSFRVRTDAERAALAVAAEAFSPEEDSLVWDGDTVRIADGDQRTLLLLASPVFRARFGSHWTCDVEEKW